MIDHAMPETERRLEGNDVELLRVCVEYPAPEFAGSWIKKECDARGVPFHQARLGRLVREGLLLKGDESRGGRRRYYMIADVERARRILSSAGVSEAD